MRNYFKEPNVNGLKKEIAEFIHSIRILIMIVLLVIILVLSYQGYDLNQVLGTIMYITLLSFFMGVLYSMFLSFETKHNYAQLAYGDTFLSKTYKPGDLIWVLPGYKIVEHKSIISIDKNGKETLEQMLLTRNEMSSKIEKKESQFAGKDSLDANDTSDDQVVTNAVIAKGIQTNFYLDHDKIYRFLMLAPKEFKTSLMSNSSGDFASSFKNRVQTLKQADDYKDFQFFTQDEIDERDENPSESKVPKYVKKEGFWLMADDSDNDSKKPAWCDNKEEYFLDEFATTVRLAFRYGLLLRNTTIDGYDDPADTEAFREKEIQQVYENRAKARKTTGRKDRVDVWKVFFKGEGFNKKDATILARNEVAIEDDGRSEIATGSNAQILVNQKGK
jgi:hypothetical protein